MKKAGSITKKKKAKVNSNEDDDSEPTPSKVFKSDSGDSPKPIKVKAVKEWEKELAEKNAPKEKDPELESRTIFIGNIPIELEKRQLAKIFKDCGTIETIRFRCATRKTPNALKKVAANKKEIHPERSSFAAFIRFKTREEAEYAIKEHNGLEINDHHLTIDMADNTSKSKDSKKGIFIGNLHIKLEDDDLWNAFQDCGKILGVRIVRDASTGIGKGIGFVNFESNDSVEIALRKDGSPLKGREMRISRISKKQKLNKLHVTGSQLNPREKRNGKWRNRKGRPRGNNSKKNDVNPSEFEGESQTQSNFAGDNLSEIGKLKRKSKKFNKGEAKKTRIAKFLLRE